MESVLGRIGNDLETLYSPTGKCSSFSSYMPRRIHLDSSSHRSLVRILSYCVNNSLFSLSTEPERTLSVKTPFSIQVRGQLHQVQEAGGNSDGRTSAESQEGDHNADCGVQGVSVDGDMLFGLDLGDCDEKEIEACVNNEELHSIMLECGRLIDEPNEEHSAESREGSGQTVPVDIAHNQLEIAEALVNGADERVSHLGEVLEVARVDRRVHDFLNDAETTRNVAVDVGNQISSVEGTGYDRSILVETQDENFRGAEEEEDEKQKPGVCSTPIVDYSGLKNFKYDQLRTLDHPIDGPEVEEGEISDEVQDLEELVDINDNVPEGQRKEGPCRDDFSNIASTSSCIHKIEVPEFGASPLDRSEENLLLKATQMKRKVVEAKEKKNKKNSTLTEERKAKKKIAKKRKRARKNREQGVKKLKLHAVVKPKEVKYCNFYRMGRCQQGDLCKFSHDLTPLTKSMPCKYFVSNSCLRGDDCPYDHELSKYPCLNYMSLGSCNRGDRCKFSHKLTDRKIDSLLTLEQQKLKNQLVDSHASPLGIGSFETKTIETVPLRNKPLTDANRVPKGIRFISFGTVQTDLTNKVEKNLPVNKSCHTRAYNHQKQDDLLAHQHKSALNLLWNSLPPENSVMSGGLVAHVSSNDFAVKDSGNATKGSPAAHPGGTANDKVSEAAKILEEFLFCGAD